MSKFNILKSRVNYLSGRGDAVFLVTDKCHFYSLLLAYGNGIFHMHCLEIRILCVFSKILNCLHFYSLSWFAPFTFRLGPWDPEVQEFHLPEYEPQPAESRTWVWIFLAACLRRHSHASKIHLLSELPCPFQIHLDITDGIASYCFALPLYDFPFSLTHTHLGLHSQIKLEL